jgi:hypothetical protein
MDLETKNMVRDLVNICVENKLDFLKVGDIEIKKSIHFKPMEVKNEFEPRQETEEELLYWSSTPNLKVNL